MTTKPRPRSLTRSATTALLTAAMVVSLAAIGPAASADTDLIDEPLTPVNSIDAPETEAPESVQQPPEPGPGDGSEPEPEPEPEPEGATESNNEGKGGAATAQTLDVEPESTPVHDLDDTSTGTDPDSGSPSRAVASMTPLSHGGPLTLEFAATPQGQQPGVTLQMHGNCGVIPSTGYRTLALAGLTNEGVVWTQGGAWTHGAFIANVSTAGVAPDSNGRYAITLTCNYGHTGPPHTVTAIYQTHPASIQGTFMWADNVPLRDATVSVYTQSGHAPVGDIAVNHLGTVGPAWFAPGNYTVEFYHEGTLVASHDRGLHVGTNATIHVRVPVPGAGSVVGSVTFPDGSPVANQQAILVGTDFRGTAVHLHTFTAADGTFDFGEVEQGNYAVRISHLALGQVAEGPVTVDSASEFIVDLIATVSPPGEITGRVTFSDSTGASEAKLRIENTTTGSTRFVTSSRSGYFHFVDLPAGDYTLTIDADYPTEYGDWLSYSSGPTDVSVIAGTTTNHDVVVALETSTLDGWVHSSADSSRMPGVTVRIPNLGLEAITDSDGFFEITGIEGTSLVMPVEVRHSSGVLLLATTAPIPEPGHHERQTFFVSPTLDDGSVQGTVTLLDDSPVIGETVRLTPAGGGPSLEATTAAGGAYEFPVVAPGDYLVEVFNGGAVAIWRDVSVANGESVTAHFKIPPTPGVIEGTIIDPVGGTVYQNVRVDTLAGALVRYGTADRLTDTFSVTGLAAGDYVVHLLTPVQPDGSPGLILGSTPVRVESGETTHATIVIGVTNPPDPGSISGAVEWLDGDPVSGATVIARGGPSTPPAQPIGADGLFAFTNLVPGHYWIEAWVDGDLIADDYVDVLEGAATVVTLTAPAAVTTVTVVVNDGGPSSPLAGAAVHVVAPDGTTYEDTTEADGIVEVTHLVWHDYTPADFTVKLVDFDLSQDVTVTVPGADETVEFTVLRGSVTVTVTDADDAAVEGLTVAVGAVSEQTDGSGVVTLSSLLPGDYTVNVSDPTGACTPESRDFTLSNNDSVDLDIEVECGAPPAPTSGAIEGVVEWLSGDPVAGARVTLTGGPSTPAAQTVGTDGLFSFGGLAAGSYAVDVEWGGSVVVSGTADAIDDETTDTTLVVPAAWTALTIEVHDGDPTVSVMDAEVHVTGPDGTIEGSTDADGRVILTRLVWDADSPLEYTIDLPGTGLSETATITTPGLHATATFTLTRGDVTFTITDPDGAPLEGLEVTVNPTGFTDESGQVTLGGILPGNHVAQITDPSGGCGAASAPFALANDSSTEVDYEFTCTLTGSGSAAAGALPGTGAGSEHTALLFAGLFLALLGAGMLRGGRASVSTQHR